MKRLFRTALVLLTLLAMTTGTVFAGSALELHQVQNNQGGPTFTFRVNGEFSRSELESGFVQVEGGDAFPLYCAQTAPDEVVCHASKKVGGHNVVVGFGGARFWTYVKEYSPRINECGFGGGIDYPVYSSNNPWPTSPTDWVAWTSVCSDSVPAEGYGYFIPGDPNDWGLIYEFDLGSNPNPGDLGSIFGLPFIEPGFYN